MTRVTPLATRDTRRDASRVTRHRHVGQGASDVAGHTAGCLVDVYIRILQYFMK